MIVDEHAALVLEQIQKGSRETAEVEFHIFVAQVHHWLNQAALERAETARQLTEFFQGTHKEPTVRNDLCVVCHQVPVAVEDGFDTCTLCSKAGY